MLARNSFQIFDFKGVIRKTLRNNELARAAVLLDFSAGLDSCPSGIRVFVGRRLVGLERL